MSMDNAVPEVKKRKRNIKSIDVDEYILRKSEKYIGDGNIFGSFSGMATVALTELLTRVELEQSNESAVSLLLKILQTPEGQLALEKVQERNIEESLSELKEETECKNHLKSKQKNIKTIELDPDYVQHYIIE